MGAETWSQITQSLDDIPFDLRPIRTLPYLNNDEGRQSLTGAVPKRLEPLIVANP